MKRLFKEREEDKISSEIMNEIYPLASLEKYYMFGYANCLSMITDMANKYINEKHSDKLDAYDLKKIINELSYSNKELQEYYFRLRKDGVKTKMEEMSE